MKVEPNYPGEIIILIKNNGQYFWFVSEKELWILDLVKLDNAFNKRSNLPEVTEVHYEDERKGFEILNEKNVDQFLEVMKDYKVDFSELKEFFKLYSEVYPEYPKEKIQPAFYIDFDKKCFYSYFDEPGSYEQYIPDGWNGYLCNGVFPQNIMIEAMGEYK